MLCIRDGGFQPPGQKRNADKIDFRVLSRFCGNQFGFHLQANSAIGVQRPKAFGAGARGPQRPSPLLGLSGKPIKVSNELRLNNYLHD